MFGGLHIFHKSFPHAAHVHSEEVCVNLRTLFTFKPVTFCQVKFEISCRKMYTTDIVAQPNSCQVLMAQIGHLPAEGLV